MADTDKAEPVIKQFNVTLAELDKGRVHNELSEKLHDLIAAAQDTGKGGSLTFTLKVTPDKGTEMLRFATLVTAKLPQRERSAAMYYVDRDGNPSRSDPNQRALFEANEARIKSAPTAIAKEA